MVYLYVKIILEKLGFFRNILRQHTVSSYSVVRDAIQGDESLNFVMLDVMLYCLKAIQMVQVIEQKNARFFCQGRKICNT